jgi:hypothetical protein
MRTRDVPFLRDTKAVREEQADSSDVQEKTLRKHFRSELNGGKFKVDMLWTRSIRTSRITRARPLAER